MEVSPALISSVTDKVIEEVKTWQNRQLDAVYPIMYLNAIQFKVRDGGHVKNKAIYLAIAINLSGLKEVLGLWIAQTEGAKFWLQVVTELKNRGVKDIFIACVDGLKGFPEATFKNDRMNTPTKKGTLRQPATVNRELTLLSSAYSLAVKYDKAESNPCSKVDLFILDNLRYRYLLPEEEPKLMAHLSGPRAHLKPAVVVALGTGMRMGEQLRMKRHQVDFLRNIVTARDTKNGRPRDIPINDDVREALAELCRDKAPNDYVFSSPKTKSCLRETKRGFRTACKLAGIEGLIWKDLRATFGTRLAEAGCDAFTIAQLLGHSDVRVTMRYVRTVEDTKRVAVEAIKLSARKNVQVLASWPKQPATALAVSH